MAKAAAAPSVDLEPIDRLEEKFKLLVGLIDRLKHDQSRVLEENQHLSREVDSLRARAASSETMTTELSALREEREVIRTRVSEMLDQLESLNL
jgi:regulator of replication initiation timing